MHVCIYMYVHVCVCINTHIYQLKNSLLVLLMLIVQELGSRITKELEG